MSGEGYVIFSWCVIYDVASVQNHFKQLLAMSHDMYVLCTK